MPGRGGRATSSPLARSFSSLDILLRSGPFRRLQRLSLACVFGLFPMVLAPAASAEVASQITPPTYQPAPVRTPSSDPLPLPPMQAAPPGAAALSVTLKSIVVQGGLPQMEARTRTLLRPLEGRTITAADLFTAAHALEVDYAKAGYVLVRVTVPVQALNDGGVATLTVTDGVIESVQARSLPSRIRRRIMALLAPLIGRHAVKYDLIERQLLLASDTPGVALSSTLAPGAAPGASDLAVQAQYRPVDLPVTADNLMASNIGRTNLGLGADFNSIFGLGELIYLRANGDPGGGGNGYFAKDPRDRALAGGLAAPLGRDGLTLDFEVSESAATPAPEPGALGVTSRFDRLSFRARYPWIRSRALNVNSELTFDVQRDALYGLTAAPEGLSLDRLRIARLSGEAAGLAPFGATFDARVTGSFGIDALGARSPAEATPELPLSRQGVNPSFQKLEAALAYHQPFRPHLAADLTFKAQSSFNEPMANSEQFGMVGPQALSGFDAGEFEGDSGAVARAELTSEWTVRTPPGGWGLTPYLFAADGEVHDVRPTAVEYAYTHAAAYGFGLHTQFISAAGWGRQAFTVEFARDDRGDRGSSSDRVSLIASAQF